MTTVSIEEANFVDRWINGKYCVKMPKFLAEHPSFDNWERERFASMEENLKRGDILFDIGAETGHISAVYAQFVGAENMVLAESNPDNWQNIKATWDTMNLSTPLATVNALISDKTVMASSQPHMQMGDWPECAKSGRIWTPRSYRYVWEHAHNTNQITIDDMSLLLFSDQFFKGLDRKIPPRAITIDVEGAELLVLRGAEVVLKEFSLLVWVSIHPELMKKNLDHDEQMLYSYMRDLGYVGEHLATDHEVHVLFRKD